MSTLPASLELWNIKNKLVREKPVCYLLYINIALPEVQRLTHSIIYHALLLLHLHYIIDLLVLEKHLGF